MSPPVTSTAAKTIQHFSHQAHPLTQTHDPREFLCDGCKTLGSGTRYRCNACDFDLHEICGMSPSSLSSTYMHPQHPLSLVLRKQQAGLRQVDRFCNACGEEVNGLFYRCKICDFDVHPICIKLPQNVKHWVHPQHLLTIQPSISQLQLSLCNLCNHYCKTWSYKCAPCGVQLHINCLARPRPPQPQPPQPPPPPPLYSYGAPLQPQLPLQQPLYNYGVQPPFNIPGAASHMFSVNNQGQARDTNTMTAGIGALGKLALDTFVNGGLGNVDFSSFL